MTHLNQYVNHMGIPEIAVTISNKGTSEKEDEFD